jgi:hypothetical protein
MHNGMQAMDTTAYPLVGVFYGRNFYIKVYTWGRSRKTFIGVDLFTLLNKLDLFHNNATNISYVSEMLLAYKNSEQIYPKINL